MFELNNKEHALFSAKNNHSPVVNSKSKELPMQNYSTIENMHSNGSAM